MREIKFRAWHKVDKKIYEVIAFNLGKWFLRGKAHPMPRSAIELLQHTGLKDKNGVEIYEGDIIHSDKKSPIGTVVTAKVYWKGAGFALLTTRGSDTTSVYLELISPFCEVIGNIYEHPHLLEVSE